MSEGFSIDVTHIGLGGNIWTKKCPVCGNKFTLSVPEEKYGYQVRKSGRWQAVCKWSCQRKWEREEAARKAAAPPQRGRGKRLDWWKTPEGAEKRIAVCREKVAHYKAVMETAETSEKRNSASGSVRRWEHNLWEAEEWLRNNLV